MYADILGDISGMEIQKDRTEKRITLYVPCLACKLISLTTILIKGFTMTCSDMGIAINKESTSYTFDDHRKSGDRELIGIEIELGHMEYANLHIGSSHASIGHPSNYLKNLTAEKWDSKRLTWKQPVKAA